MSKLEDFIAFVNKNLPDFPKAELDKWVKRNQSLISDFELEDCFNSITNYYNNELTLKEGQKSQIVYLFGQYNKIFDSFRSEGEKTVKNVNIGMNKEGEFVEFEHYGTMPKGVRELSSMPNFHYVDMIYTEKKWSSKDGKTSGITNNLANIRKESDEIIIPIKSKLPSMGLEIKKGAFIYGSGKILEVMTLFENKIPCSFYSNQELTCRIKFVPLSSKGVEGKIFEGIIHLKRMRIGKRSTSIYNQESLDKWLIKNNTDNNFTKETNLAMINKQRHFINELFTNQYVWFLGKGDIKSNEDIESPIQMNINCYDTGYLAIMEKPYILEDGKEEKEEETQQENDVKDPGPIKEPKPKEEKKEEKTPKNKKMTIKNVSDIDKKELTQLMQKGIKSMNLKKPKDIVKWFKNSFMKEVSEGLVKEILEEIKNPEDSTKNII